MVRNADALFSFNGVNTDKQRSMDGPHPHGHAAARLWDKEWAAKTTRAIAARVWGNDVQVTTCFGGHENAVGASVPAAKFLYASSLDAHVDFHTLLDSSRTGGFQMMKLDLFAGPIGSTELPFSPAELYEKCPVAFKRLDNEWNGFAAGIRRRHQVETKTWNFRSSDADVRHDQIACLTTMHANVLATGTPQQHDALVAWMLSEMLQEVPSHGKALEHVP